MRRLTEAQAQLLRELDQFGSSHVAEHYAPRKRLLELGHIEIVPGDEDRVRLTDAGRRALPTEDA